MSPDCEFETGGPVAKVPEADQPTEINGCAQSLCMLKYALVKHNFLETVCPLFPWPGSRSLDAVLGCLEAKSRCPTGFEALR